MLRQVIQILVLVIGVPCVLYQVKKPTRWIGRPFLWSMNRSHSNLTDWGLEHVSIDRRFSILDVGCGGGRTIQKLAAIASEGRVAGVDYSTESVDTARAKNAESIHAGRVEIRQASVSQMPYPDATFDIVTAVETHYYWPDPPRDLREVLRVLKPGGSSVVIAEVYRRSGNDFVQRLVMKLLRTALLTADEHREWFASAGFLDVQVLEEPKQGWICVTGRRPVTPVAG